MIRDPCERRSIRRVRIKINIRIFQLKMSGAMTSTSTDSQITSTEPNLPKNPLDMQEFLDPRPHTPKEAYRQEFRPMGDSLGCGASTDDVICVELINEDTFNGSVRLEKGHKLVMKTIRYGYDNNKSDSVTKEVEIMKRLAHVNVLKVYYHQLRQTPYFLVTEFCDRGDFFEFLDACLFNKDIVDGKRKSAPISIDENVQQCYASQLLSAVGHCHSKGVYHLDIKVS